MEHPHYKMLEPRGTDSICSSDFYLIQKMAFQRCFSQTIPKTDENKIDVSKACADTKITIIKELDSKPDLPTSWHMSLRNACVVGRMKSNRGGTKDCSPFYEKLCHKSWKNVFTGADSNYDWKKCFLAIRMTVILEALGIGFFWIGWPKMYGGSSYYFVCSRINAI